MDYNNFEDAARIALSDISIAKKSEHTGDLIKKLYLHAKHFVDLCNEGAIVRIFLIVC